MTYLKPQAAEQNGHASEVTMLPSGSQTWRGTIHSLSMILALFHLQLWKLPSMPCLMTPEGSG